MAFKERGESQSVIPRLKSCRLFRRSVSILKYVLKSFNEYEGERFDDSVPGYVTKTAPSGDGTTWFPTWSPSLPRIQLILPGCWPNMSPEGASFVQFSP